MALSLSLTVDVPQWTHLERFSLVWNVSPRCLEHLTDGRFEWRLHSFFFLIWKKKNSLTWNWPSNKDRPSFLFSVFLFLFFCLFFVFCNRGTPLLHVAATATEKKIKIKWKKRMFHHLNKSAEDGWVDGRMQRKRKAKRKSESDGFDGRFVTLRRYWKRSISIWKK